MKLFNAIVQAGKRRDDAPLERLEYNRVRATIEEQCARYLRYSDDVFKFEALPNAIDATLACLESPQFLEKYEFNQVSETCFVVRLKELDIL